jgi:hypothetical protein
VDFDNQKIAASKYDEHYNISVNKCYRVHGWQSERPEWRQMFNVKTDSGKENETALTS